MESKEIKILVERYFDGATTLEEEARIAQYFATHNIVDEELEVVRDMFIGLSELRSTSAPEPKMNIVAEQRNSTWLWLGRMAAIAAVVAVVLFSINPLTDTNSDTLSQSGIVCHINGVVVDDPEMVASETNRILGCVADNMALAMASIEKFNILSIE